MLRIAQRASNAHVPLKEVHIDARIHSFAADVTLTQIFKNDESVPIEAVYCFPVEENAAIYAFVARIDDEREVVAELKEKKTAQQEYMTALAQGHGAYLLEQDAASGDIFIVNVGALKPGSKCLITISYVSELDLLHSGDKPIIRFVLPTVVAPRYSPAHQGISSPGGTQVQYTQSVPYTVRFDCRVDRLEQQVASVSSPSHPIKVDLSDEQAFLVTFGQEEVQLDRDIIVDIELPTVRANAIAAVDNGAMMVSFIPTAHDCQQSANTKIDEFLFIIDCSGSMESEDKIGLASKAMLLFLKSLPVGCRLNIIRFGSSFKPLFSDQITREYNEKTMQVAQSLIMSMRADMGGTELFEPLHWLKKSKTRSGGVRQIFLLTDGEVSNVDEVIDVCQEMAGYTRIFSFGLGRSPSRALVKGIARATNGYFTFIPPSTSVDIYVAEQLNRALHPSIADVNVHWKTGQKILHTAPKQTPPVFVGDRLLFYALVDESMPFDHTTTVELIAKGYSQPLGVVRIDRIPSVLTTPTVTRLAAKALLRELQQASNSTSKKHLVNVSLQYGILCPQTAFIAVERRLNVDASSNVDMQLREVPIVAKAATDLSSFQSLMQVDAAQAMMQCNISKILERGEMLDSLSLHADALQCSASQFEITSSRMYKKSALSLGSVFQPAVNYLSSLFASKQVTTRKADTYTASAQPPEDSNSSWPTDEQRLVDRLIERQQFDGTWTLTDDDVQQLTGKALSEFTSASLETIEANNRRVASTTAIAIAILERRCTARRALWQGLANKARLRLAELLQGDQTKVEQLIKDILDQLL